MALVSSYKYKKSVEVDSPLNGILFNQHVLEGMSARKIP